MFFVGFPYPLCNLFPLFITFGDGVRCNLTRKRVIIWLYDKLPNLSRNQYIMIPVATACFSHNSTIDKNEVDTCYSKS